MKEKLVIKNFGPIKSVELELGRFTILIGEQGTGKSTIAKVLAVCRYFSYIIDELGTYPSIKSDSSFLEGLAAWGLDEGIYENSYINYSCIHYSVTIEKSTIILHRNLHPVLTEQSEIILLKPKLEAKSNEFQNLLNQLEKIKPSYTEDRSPNAIAEPVWRIPYSFYSIDVKNVLDNPFYLPTDRGLQSIFSVGQSSLQNMNNFLFNYYSKVDGILRTFNKETEVEPLDIFYENRNGIGYIRKKNEKEFYLLYNAASGYQSTVPVVLVMKYYELKKRKKTFIIEEPELNLFPTAQNRLMQYFVEKTIVNADKIFFTTQSPYTLTSLNNMMYAYQVGKIDANKTAAIIDNKYWLNPDEVSVYMLNRGGTAENIMDREILQIKAEKIDEVSREFNREYDEMLDIKYAKNNEG